MFYFRRPSVTDIEQFLKSQSECEVTYVGVGGTNGTPPAGYTLDHHRFELGQGEADWQKARSALQRWRQFELGWLEAIPNDAPLTAGAQVAVLARAFGMWILNAARIVYVIDEPTRFGFAYGTLPRHVETGEERFLLELNPASGGVSYDILAFSRPRHVFTRIAYPVTRRMQKRFALDSGAAMQRAVV
jgi:uncharacterized protein (UPF0548 family)